MLGYNISGFSREFTTAVVEASNLIVNKVWSTVTSERAIATYKAIRVIAIYASATAYVLGVLAREYYESQKLVAFVAYAESAQAVPQVRPVVLTAARWAARVWVAYWRLVQRGAEWALMQFWILQQRSRLA